MKVKLIIITLLLCKMMYGQTPSMFLRMSHATDKFNWDLPTGTMLLDLDRSKLYITLVPIGISEGLSLSTCSKLLNDGRSVLGTAPAQIKEVRTNGMTHYVGELIDSNPAHDPPVPDGIAVFVWIDNGIEKVLLMNLTEAYPNKMNYTFVSTETDLTKWHLPTYYELNHCYNGISYINTILPVNGGTPIKPDDYWSSTPAPWENWVYVKNCQLGGYTTGSKSDVATVHYIRYMLVHY